MPFSSTDRDRRPILIYRSVGELALSSEQSIRAVGQAQAAYTYCVPIVSGQRTGEIVRWTKGRTQAYRHLIADLRRTARTLGANAVIAVQFHLQSRDWAEGCVEIIASGTAVVFGSLTTTAMPPLVTTLTAGEIYALQQSGYGPVGCAIGVCAYRQKAREGVARKLGTGTISPHSGEHTDFSGALDKARRSAVSRMEKDSENNGATGTLGISVAMEVQAEEKGSFGMRKIEQMVFTLIAIGTPVVAERTSELLTAYVLPLGNKMKG